MAKDKNRSEIKQDLLDQLDRNGTVGKQYTDLAEDYIRLWDAKNALLDDIKKRGAKVEVYAANGTANIKTNDSVPDSLKVSQQMLKIIDALGIKPSQSEGDSGDEM